ncbi:hypothetical protein F7734_14870 [Scytonema sp. UIC 10036]|uniref:hypothetical protein n=1 Tax=Scytonema sp. UIC 10036 TaxID=2304196 RepID=UPI0012DA1B32|nr:hypothetical protein [Scytonema sp. UIC 10036]MUG93632.1 hypothetical protein [Scytonema sp. UIC 10036]
MSVSRSSLYNLGKKFEEVVRSGVLVHSVAEGRIIALLLIIAHVSQIFEAIAS